MASMAPMFKAMADETRQRLLQVLSHQELSVSELVDVLAQPQSTISRHLKVLREAGLVAERRVGNTVLHSAYPIDRHAGLERSSGHGAPLSANGFRVADIRDRLVQWAGQEVLDGGLRDRLEAVIRRRHADNGTFFERVGTRWDQLRIESFGDSFHLEALTALLPETWTVADIGTGTGYMLPALARRFRHVIAVEPAGAMLDAARARPELQAAGHVDFREGSLAALPLEAGEVDLAIASLVLHHVPAPADAIRELHRIVRPGGRLLLIEQQPHENGDFQARMGDHWRGFAPDEMGAWTARAGFVDIRICTLTTARSAGRHAGDVPGLYVLVARAEQTS